MSELSQSNTDPEDARPVRAVSAERRAADASHEDLMARVATGDRRAFESLYGLISARVFGLVRRLVIDPSQSEEVTQEVFLEIWQNAPRYDPQKGGVMSWVMTLAHRRAVDRIRASQASHDRDLRIGIRDHTETVDDVSEIVEVIVEDERVRRGLARLTALQRQAIELSYYGGFTHAEIADRLHVPTGTIKTRLRDGLIRLRDELGVTS